MEPGRRVRPSLFVVLLFLLLLLTCLFMPYLNHDVALYLTGAREVLAGAAPGRDFVDTNPPLILYLSAIPVMLSRATGLPTLPASQLSLLALCAWSLLRLGRHLRAEPFGLDASERSVLGALWLIAALRTYLDANFGQRELLFVWLAAPFVVLRAARHEGGGAGRLAAAHEGVAAFVGASLKPAFGITLAALELVQLARSRRWRTLVAPEMLALGAGAAAYGTFLLTSPAMSDYFSTWAPLIVSAYGAYDASPGSLMTELATNPLHLAGLSLSIVGGYLATRGGPTRRLAGLASVAWFVSVAFFFLQAKGWSYHLIPATHAALALAGLAVVLALRRERSGAADPAPGGLANVILVSLLAVAFAMNSGLPGAMRLRPQWAALGPLPDLIRNETNPGDAVMVLDTSLAPTYPALTLTGRRPGSRFSCLWPLPMVYYQSADYDHPREPALEARFYMDLVEDVRRNRPGLVLVRQFGCQACPPFLSVDGYLEQRGFYRTALDGYAEEAPLPLFRVFRLRGR